MAQIRPVQTAQGSSRNRLELVQSRQRYGHFYGYALVLNTLIRMVLPYKFGLMFARLQPEQQR